MLRRIAIFIALLPAALLLRADDAPDYEAEHDALLRRLQAAQETPPSKEAQKIAKELYKEGWRAPVGEPSLEQQLMRSILLDTELMDDGGRAVKRYLQHTAISTARSYDMAYAACRSIAQNEMAGLISTELESVVDSEIDTSDAASDSDTGKEAFRQRSRSIVQGTYGKFVPVLVMYRKLSNRKYEVSLRLAYDKKNLMRPLEDVND